MGNDSWIHYHQQRMRERIQVSGHRADPLSQASTTGQALHTALVACLVALATGLTRARHSTAFDPDPSSPALLSPAPARGLDSAAHRRMLAPSQRR